MTSTPRVAAANRALVASLEALTGAPIAEFGPAALDGLRDRLGENDRDALREALLSYWSQLGAAAGHDDEEVPAEIIDELERAINAIDSFGAGDSPLASRPPAPEEDLELDELD